jgi:hypothetical protein
MRQVVRRQLFVAAVTAALLIATGVVATLAAPLLHIATWAVWSILMTMAMLTLLKVRPDLWR